MKRLILLRHAQSEHHIRGLTGGWTDTSLSPLGRAQAALLAERCKKLLIGEQDFGLFSSDLARAAETAQFLSQELSTPVLLEPALRELNNGLAAGLTVEEAKRIELPVTEPDIDWVPYPGAESWRQMTERVFAAMDEIDARCPATTVVVTHGGAGIAVIQWWLRLDENTRQGISFELDPASISELTINAHRERTIVRLNDTGHLALLHGTDEQNS